MRGRETVGIIAVTLLAFTAAPLRAAPAEDLNRIAHIVVIFQENWSFDALHGSFPEANGLANASPGAILQVDRDDRPYASLPRPVDRRLSPPAPDARFPADLPNAPFNMAQFVLPTEIPGSPVHEFYREQHQINGGRMKEVRRVD